jgi:hypothetical protein
LDLDLWSGGSNVDLFWIGFLSLALSKFVVKKSDYGNRPATLCFIKTADCRIGLIVELNLEMNRCCTRTLHLRGLNFSSLLPAASCSSFSDSSANRKLKSKQQQMEMVKEKDKRFGNVIQ